MAAAIWAGCGGDDGAGAGKTGTATTASPASGPPEAAEPLAESAERLERAVAQGSCGPLARLLLHSATRGTSPTALTDPPTAQECTYVKNEARISLAGLEVTEVDEFSPAGVTDGTGTRSPRGGVLAVAWVLDRDGSWKAVFNAILKRPQAGISPDPVTKFDANAQRFVTATATRDCDGMWRLLNVFSRFVRDNDGDKAKFCKGLPASYDNPRNGIADLAKNPDARPQLIGGTADFGFYGVELDSGRYMVVVLTGRIGGFAEAEQKQHDDPSVVELVTVRRPPD